MYAQHLCVDAGLSTAAGMAMKEVRTPAHPRRLPMAWRYVIAAPFGIAA